MIDVPVIVTVGGIAFTTAGTLIAVYKIGVDKGAKKNGFVARADCKSDMGEINKNINDLFEKTNETNENVAYIRGKIDQE